MVASRVYSSSDSSTVMWSYLQTIWYDTAGSPEGLKRYAGIGYLKPSLATGPLLPSAMHPTPDKAEWHRGKVVMSRTELCIRPPILPTSRRQAEAEATPIDPVWTAVSSRDTRGDSFPIEPFPVCMIYKPRSTIALRSLSSRCKAALLFGQQTFFSASCHCVQHTGDLPSQWHQGLQERDVQPCKSLPTCMFTYDRKRRVRLDVLVTNDYSKYKDTVELARLGHWDDSLVI